MGNNIIEDKSTWTQTRNLNLTQENEDEAEVTVISNK